eukprot:8073553-Alexandrium_andersonii.AAC.1
MAGNLPEKSPAPNAHAPQRHTSQTCLSSGGAHAWWCLDTSKPTPAVALDSADVAGVSSKS